MGLSIRVFDTILHKQKGDSATRNSADFWRPFCAASDWRFNYERVHSLQDIEFFFSKTIREDVIIFSGHGSAQGGGFHLSNGDTIDGTQSFTKVAKNAGKIVIFSSCLIGRNGKLAEALKTAFAAKMLFAYQHEMEDRFCFLNEVILLTMLDRKLEQGKRFTDSDFIDFAVETDFMKNMNQKGVKNHPMLMF